RIATRLQPCRFSRGPTNNVQEYWKLATAIIPTMPAVSCTQRLPGGPASQNGGRGPPGAGDGSTAPGWVVMVGPSSRRRARSTREGDAIIADDGGASTGIFREGCLGCGQVPGRLSPFRRKRDGTDKVDNETE